VRIVNLLLQYGANPNGQNPRFRPEYRSGNPLANCLKLYREANRIISRGQPIMDALILAGANIQIRSTGGHTLLHVAVMNLSGNQDGRGCGYIDFLTHHIPVDARDNGSKSALHYARNIQCVRRLLDAGASPLTRDIGGKQPAWYEVIDGYNVHMTTNNLAALLGGADRAVDPSLFFAVTQRKRGALAIAKFLVNAVRKRQSSKGAADAAVRALLLLQTNGRTLANHVMQGPSPPAAQAKLVAYLQSQL